MVSFNILSLATELPLVGQSANRDKSQDAESKATDSAEPQDTDSVKESGVYIQDVNGKLWKTEEWDYSAKPNAIAVITKETKFLIALSQSAMRLSNSDHTPLENHMFETSFSSVAKGDYNGVGNTANILKAQSNASFAAGYCKGFTFPDKKTRGYLPSLGQLYLAYQNKAAVDSALSACGGTAMIYSKTAYWIYYWSSTFWGADCSTQDRCWALNWSNGDLDYNLLDKSNYVRPFADLT